MNQNDQVLWNPSEERKKSSEMWRFWQRVQEREGCQFGRYQDFHQWSIENPGRFWQHLAEFTEIKYEGDLEPSHEELQFLQYPWFPQVKLNFAENLLVAGKGNDTALFFHHESGLERKLSYAELTQETLKLEAFLEQYISSGDVVAAYMPNIPETVIGMLATTSLGGIFTSTSADFGVQGVIDRFGQTEPKVLITVPSYSYNGKVFDQREKLKEIIKALPSLKAVVVVDFLKEIQGKSSVESLEKVYSWEKLPQASTKSLQFKKMSFCDPLYIMYSSGTTGKPKCIVHSVGGTLLQHFKELKLHSNLTRQKNIFYFTTCGWMMWNWLVSSLGIGATVTLYEGAPAHPSFANFFKFLNEAQVNIWGTSPKFLQAVEQSEETLPSEFPHLETILSTGAPLMPEQFDYVYDHIKKDVQLSSIAGGTDIIGCFMLGNPLSPVRRGEIQCLGLGMDVACFNERGEEVVNEEGELVCRQSFPSQPVGFWNDPHKEKFKKAYFERFPGVWHHGDFILMTEEKSVIVYGRSDAILNPGGVRIGTAEIYRQTERLDYLADSLCVGREDQGDVSIVLFVKMKEGEKLSEDRIKEIKSFIRQNTTPRHTPREVHAVSDIPYTRSGKKMEMAVNRILNNKKLTNIEAVSNPECLKEYESFR